MLKDNSKGPEGGWGRVRSRLSSLVHRTDSILAAIILSICGALYYVTTRFEKVPDIVSQNIPPEWFPRLVLWVIAILTVIIPFEHLFLEKGKGGLDEDRRARIKPISIYSAVLLCCVVALMPWLGTSLAMVFVCVLLPMLWGESRIKVVLPFAIVFAGLVTLLFTKVLGLYFEPGVLAKLF